MTQHHFFRELIEKNIPSITRLVRISDLLDPQPLDLITNKEGLSIRLKYYVSPKS